MYGLPKLHKDGVPLRPILSMVNAPQQEMAKWLGELLRPVVVKYGARTLKDTFEFCERIDQFASENDTQSMFMCSFDGVSLFTNVPLRETINIALDALCRDPDIAPPSQPEALIRKMLLKATSEVEFSFDGTMYKQLDGVAMGSPLGPILANVFVGYHEAQVPQDEWPQLYERFVDDVFSVFLSENHAEHFFNILNGLHPALRFTMEIEADSKLPFMDILVQRTNGSFARSVYRKPTFTGLYTRWDSFSPTSQKIGLIKSLKSRALKICSESMLQDEFDKLKDIFVENGYPIDVIEKHLRIQTGKANRGTADAAAQTGDAHGTAGNTGNATAFLRLPWMGQVSNKFRGDILKVISKGYPKVEAKVVFTTARAFSGRGKDVLSATSQSFIVYQFTCRCSWTYVGKTTQLLSERIKQHIPDRLFVNLRGKPVKTSSDSAITKHLCESVECTQSEDIRRSFKILAKARHSKHLDVLEALYIRKKSPDLCQQKKQIRVVQLV